MATFALVHGAWHRSEHFDLLAGELERLGAEPIELPGGHSPFLSRPSELADMLDRLAG